MKSLSICDLNLIEINTPIYDNRFKKIFYTVSKYKPPKVDEKQISYDKKFLLKKHGVLFHIENTTLFHLQTCKVEAECLFPRLDLNCLCENYITTSDIKFLYLIENEEEKMSLELGMSIV